MPDLFISYAREDRSTALALAEVLQARGIDVWWDRELTGGGDFASEIEQQLRSAQLALVLWSAASVRSDFVRDESSRARDMQKLLPVRIAEVDLPLGFGTLHTLDMLGWEGDPDDAACQHVVAQVRQRLAQARGGPAGSAEARVAMARQTAEGSLTLRRRRHWLLWAVGGAGAAGVAGLGAVGWQRFNQREALAHLGQGIDEHFASPPRLERAQSEYANALALDAGLAPAHYFLGHLYAQLMLRGSPAPSGEVLQALRNDARGHFEQALADAERLDSSAQRLIARQQLGLLNQHDPAPAVTRSAEAALPATPDPAVPRAAGPSTEPAKPTPDRILLPLARMPPPAAVALRAQEHSQAAFSSDRDGRLSATSTLTLDPVGAAEALPSLAAQARSALRDAPEAESTRLGLASTLALLERASPASLRESRAAVQDLLADLTAAPGQAANRDAAGRVGTLLQRSFSLRPVAYLQIASERQRPVAERLARQLAEAGYFTPPIEVTGEARAPARPSLRSQGGSDPDLARWCQQALARAVGAEADLAWLRNARPSTDTYEIWFDKNLCAPGGRALPDCGS
jgi:hypothetical protein